MWALALRHEQRQEVADEVRPTEALGTSSVSELPSASLQFGGSGELC